MNKKKKSNKITSSHKLTMGAVSILTVIGGWQMIGRVENNAAGSDIVVEEIPNPIPTIHAPTATPWPTIPAVANIPRLEIGPLPTLSSIGLSDVSSDPASSMAAGSLDIAAMPSAAPMPTLAPLPNLPEYAPPPPPPPPQVAANPPANSGGGGGGNQSKGS